MTRGGNTTISVSPLVVWYHTVLLPRCYCHFLAPTVHTILCWRCRVRVFILLILFCQMHTAYEFIWILYSVAFICIRKNCEMHAKRPDSLKRIQHICMRLFLTFTVLWNRYCNTLKNKSGSTFMKSISIQTDRGLLSDRSFSIIIIQTFYWTREIFSTLLDRLIQWRTFIHIESKNHRSIVWYRIDW